MARKKQKKNFKKKVKPWRKANQKLNTPFGNITVKDLANAFRNKDVA